MKIILLLSLLVLCASQNYACIDSSMIKDEKICKYVTNDTIYLRACPFGEICEKRPEGGDKSLTYCEPLNLPKFHGEYCNLNTECYTNNCVKNKCIKKMVNLVPMIMNVVKNHFVKVALAQNMPQKTVTAVN